MRLALLALPLLLVACGRSGRKDDTAGELVGDAAAGAEVYAANCTGCHGASGEGGSGPAMADEVPEKSDEELADIIANGGGGMPPFDLAEQDMADLIAFLRENYG